MGATGFEPLTSSVSANGREALCGWPFPQVAANRRCRSYAFPWRLVLSPSLTHGIRDCVRGSVDAGARLGTGPRLGRGPVRGRAGLQRRGSRRPARCLGDNCPYSAQTAPAGSRQLRLGRHSVECGLVGCSRVWWNDRQNDQLSKRRRCPTARSRRARARPQGQSDLLDKQVGCVAVRSWVPRPGRARNCSACV